MKIFGEEIIDVRAIGQLHNCVGNSDIGVLTADAHVGYGHPIGGAVAYKDRISLSGVGFDIACGNKAVRTNINAEDIDVARTMDRIVEIISFGIGRTNNEKVDDPVFDKIKDLPVATTRRHKNELLQLARSQLGTVGSGNHFVDLFKDDDGFLWIGVHFGSRGFGHRLTTGFIAASQGLAFDDKAKIDGMFGNPVTFTLESEIGQDYLHCLELAGEYAYAGRNWVVNRVLAILDNPELTYEVHNHHNFAWREEHHGEKYLVVRKGCTPAFPGQNGFVGANMFDDSVILEGVNSEASREGLYSTVHGAGRVMSRRQATGKSKFIKSGGKRVRKIIKPGRVDFRRTMEKARELGIELRGGGADESPECYKNLDEVLSYQEGTVRILYKLHPIGVAMAGADVYDPYRD